MSAKQSIIVGMSGGVDSSVAALLLLQQGHSIEGLFMKNWEEDDDADYCSAAEDLHDAQSVCDTLGIKLHTVNFSSEYWDNVFQHFLAEYEAGRTPNPDVMCNREIKFKAFLDFAQGLGAERIATGHYARTRESNGHIDLLRSRDTNKDQTYFLHTLDQQQLTHACFPLGDITKDNVRNLAREASLTTHKKKDSTGICFIGERRFRDFLQRFLPARPGDIVSRDGDKLGEHDGLMYYTLGQRQGLRLGGVAGCEEQAWYVAAKELESNRLIVVQGHDHPLMLSRGLQAGEVHWIGEAPQLPLACTARVRYRQSDQDCKVTRNENGSYTVVFKEQQRAVTPGQSVVFYKDERCLGGGVIDNILHHG